MIFDVHLARNWFKIDIVSNQFWNSKILAVEIQASFIAVENYENPGIQATNGENGCHQNPVFFCMIFYVSWVNTEGRNLYLEKILKRIRNSYYHFWLFLSFCNFGSSQIEHYSIFQDLSRSCTKLEIYPYAMKSQ